MKKCFLLIASICAAAFQIHAQQACTRIEKKSFSDISEILFDHSYGNITVVESGSQQIELEIQYFDSKEIKPVCEISETNKILKIKTVYPGRRINRSNRTKIAIDYVIAVPKNIAMNVTLKYGHITAGDFYGEFTCNLAYCSLNVNKFFESPAKISSQYSNIKIDRSEILNLSANYGNVNISDVEELDAKLKYTPVSVGNIGKKLTMESAYSNIKIGNISKQVESVKFDCSYSNLDLQLDPDLSANLDVRLKYGKLSVNKKYSVKYSLSETDNFNNKVIRKGIIGNKASPAASIVISNSYANVSIQ
jgi:hypothetical protein